MHDLKWNYYKIDKYKKKIRDKKKEKQKLDRIFNFKIYNEDLNWMTVYICIYIHIQIEQKNLEMNKFRFYVSIFLKIIFR